jgi:hypothetical protein
MAVSEGSFPITSPSHFAWGIESGIFSTKPSGLTTSQPSLLPSCMAKCQGYSAKYTEIDERGKFPLIRFSWLPPSGGLSIPST